MYAVIEAADLDEAQEQRLERELGRQYHLIARDDRLDAIAKDVVQHFLGRGFQGKAMIVSIDKATALRMHDKVRVHWEAERRVGHADEYRGRVTRSDVNRLRAV
jgi:type I restriction enzyme R subunit